MRYHSDEVVSVLLQRLKDGAVTANQQIDSPASYQYQANRMRLVLNAMCGRYNLYGPQSRCRQRLRHGTAVHRGSICPDAGEAGGRPASALGDGRAAWAFQVNKTKEASDASPEKVVHGGFAELAKSNPAVTFPEVISTAEETRETYEKTVHGPLEGCLL